MTSGQVFLNTIQCILVGALAMGLITRGRWRLCWSFTGYVTVNIVFGSMSTVWPGRFYNHATWIPYLAVIDMLKVGIGLETGWRTFSAFPGAASAARHTALLILAATLVATARVPVISPYFTSFQTTVLNLHPRAIDGAIWLMAAVLLIARWYRVPADRFHSSILASLAVYELFFSSLLRLFAGHDFESTRLFVNAVDGPVYILLTCWWIHVAWRADSAVDRLHVDTLRTLERAAYLGRVSST